MPKVKTVFWIIVLYSAFLLVTYGCAASSTTSSSTYNDQETNYAYCIEGVPQENAQHWKRECLLKSATLLPAPFLSAWYPISYNIQKPGLDEVFTFSVETDAGQVYRRLVAETQQTFPVGKRVTLFARLHAIEIDGVCVFLDDSGDVESIAETCQVAQNQRWHAGQAGYDGRTAIRIEAVGIAEKITQDLFIGSSYDWLAFIFHKPQ